MTNSNAEPPGPSKELSEEKRAAALRAGRTPVPPKFIMWAVVTFAVLGLGGVVVDHYFGSIAPTPTTVPTNRATTTTLAEPPTSALTPAQYIGLKLIDNTKEFPFTLYDQSGGRWNLASTKGKVVVLTFYNSICNDICPVLGAEIQLASHELGAEGSTVHFVIVNTDPNATKISSSSPALTVPGLGNDPSVTLLSGSVDTLNHVWSAYGVRVAVGAKASEVSHNNALYFIGPNGNLSAYATPFGTESKTGLYSLNASSLRTYARAIAETADSLVQ